MTSHIIAKEIGLQVPHFLQGERIGDSLRSILAGAVFSRSRRELRTLLNGVTFEAREGDRIALMGRNGAGKTTLLRILTGAFHPTSGTLDVVGSRQALLNLGLGFNAEASVRENVLLRAIAMGMRASEIQQLLGSVLDFAELSAVANHRLVTLSSGQRIRLGFAISTATQHDIMLLDEWLGAGDAAFVEKARKRLTDRVDGSKIVLLASHNLQMLRKVCTKGMVIDGGRLIYFGGLESAISEYKKIYQVAQPPVATDARPNESVPLIVSTKQK